MAQGYRSFRPGDLVFVRAIVLEHCTNRSKTAVACLKIEDYPGISITTFAPLSEIGTADDVQRLVREAAERTPLLAR